MEILICNTCLGIGKIKSKTFNNRSVKMELEDCMDCNGTGRLVKEIIIRPFDPEKDAAESNQDIVLS
jgi:hypothetical protein